MEVRVEQTKKNLFHNMKKPNIPWKLILSCLMVCLLAGMFAWNYGRKTAQADEAGIAGLEQRYDMEIDQATNKRIFRVVEVVPEKSQAVLGFYIKNQEVIAFDEIQKLIRDDDKNGYQTADYSRFFWWEGKSIDGREPFSVVTENGQVSIINNEIFKLCMLGVGIYDDKKSPYDNLIKNKAALENFDAHYIIDYKIMTPSEFSNYISMDESAINHIQYLHIGNGLQIYGIDDLYKATGNQNNMPNGTQQFSNSDDISGYDIVDKIYQRAISTGKRLSVSFNVYPFWDGNSSVGHTKLNIYKLYVALNYFDDPKNFEEFYLFVKNDGNRQGNYTSQTDYIDNSKPSAVLVLKNHDAAQGWTWSNLDQLWNIKKPDVGRVTSTTAQRPGNYIPVSQDNILLYSFEQGKKAPSRFMEDSRNILAIRQILNPVAGVSEDPEVKDGSVKVLEIEPCNSYWLDEAANLTNLAAAIDVNEDDISVTYVTPNELNGMTVDLVADFDLIFIGDDTSLFQSGSGYTPSNPYHHNGFIESAVIPQTLINGLLAGDYSTKEAFDQKIIYKTQGASLNVGSSVLEDSTSRYWNSGIREQWENVPRKYFLNNVELLLELQQIEQELPGVKVTDSVSKARFSGNDLTRYMQKQLIEFLESGQPVVVPATIYGDGSAADKMVRDFHITDQSKNGSGFADNKHDSRLYFALYGIEDEREYYDNSAALPITTYTNICKKEDVEQGNRIQSVDQGLKPFVEISDTGTNVDSDGNKLHTIMAGGNTGQTLNSLVASNTLTFNFRITLPRGDELKNCVMTVVVDQNGDGIFDERGEGKTKVTSGDRKGLMGTQNNAGDTIKNDKVYTYEFAGKTEGIDFVRTGDRLTGTFTAQEPVDAMEEFCQFRVIVTTKDASNKRRGAATGYMRPELKQKSVKVLQITPYSDKVGGKSLNKNKQFVDLIGSLGTGAQYQFDFVNSYTVISEADFSSQCEGGEITAESLKEYDLIISGTDFNSSEAEDIVDIEPKAAEVLTKYVEELKRPIIFTRDAMSYVNSKNYVAPDQQDYYFRDMTIEEGRKYKDTAVFDNVNFRKRELTAKEYAELKEKNDILKGEGKLEDTVYLEPESGDLYTKDIPAGTYYAIIAPLKSNVADDRFVENISIGWKFLIWDSGEKNVLGIRADGSEKEKNWQLDSSELADLFSQKGYTVSRKSTWYGFKTNGITVGYVTQKEYDNVFADLSPATINQLVDWIIVPIYKPVNFLLKDFYPLFQSRIQLPADVEIDETQYWDFNGKRYYFYQGKYLAEREENIQKDVEYGYKWQMAVNGNSGESESDKKTYSLIPVAGSPALALYPSQKSWNYYMTQSLRNVIGMDRFGVTTDTEQDKKRDSGSSRRWAERKELQGFTNGTLLEYAYLPPKNSARGGLVNENSLYADPLLALGIKPRTEAVEVLNDGPICHYPFEIRDEGNVSETKIPILENHAPYYQLDLEREIEEGKIDDVTVWYTFSGAMDEETEMKKRDSKYFDATRRDAGNNYYLYSKGKIYYTGFSLNDRSGGEGLTNPLIPDLEMKLFINTIYAALTSETATEQNPYKAVVQEDGTTTCIENSETIGINNRYVCYYEEGDTSLELNFRIQKADAAELQIPISISEKTGQNADGTFQKSELDVGFYQLSPEGTVKDVFPVVKTTKDAQTGLETPENDIWYTLSIPLSDATRSSWDGKILVIGAAKSSGGAQMDVPLREDAIHAEIRLVERILFELD